MDKDTVRKIASLWIYSQAMQAYDTAFGACELSEEDAGKIQAEVLRQCESKGGQYLRSTKSVIEYVLNDKKRKHERRLEESLSRLVQIVRSEQFASGSGPPTIRSLAVKLGSKQSDLLLLCEDSELNVNVGIRCGNGIGTFESIGDYTVEDLSVRPTWSDDVGISSQPRPLHMAILRCLTLKQPTMEIYCR
jgi:hypothetical protein